MKLIFCFIFVFVLFANAALPQQTQKDCELINFRYLITYDERFTRVSRNIGVFLDKTAFSEKNLKNLFVYLAKEYSGTKILIIHVSTDWKQLPLPVDCGPRGISDVSTEPENFEHHEASYYRNDNTEFFRYNPILRTGKFKKVILKLR